MSDHRATSNFIRNGWIASGSVLTAVVVLAQRRMKQQKKLRAKLPALAVPSTRDASGKKAARPAVNGVFVKRFKRLLRILVPSLWSAEAGYTALVGGMLVARTLCDVWMISNGTSIERAIIARNPAEFRYYVLRYASLMLPISVINQLLKYGLQEMGLRFRVRLSEHLYGKYMQGFTYYRISNLDQTIGNVDQLLTNDVQKFCDSVVDLYSNLAKPLLDIVIYTIKLAGSHGIRGPGTMLSYLFMSGVVLTTLRRPLGRLTVEEQKLEGDFRFVNSRVIAHGEEIAFYGGNRTEAAVLDGAFKRLVYHLRAAMEFRFSMGVVDNIIAKYFATVVGYFVVSRPFMSTAPSRLDGMAQGELMEDYYRSGRMLVNLASAVGRIVLAGRELTRLSAYTARVHDLLERVTNMTQSGAEPFRVREDGSGEAAARAALAAADDGDALDAHGLSESLRARLEAWRERCDARDAKINVDDPMLRAPKPKGDGELVVVKGAAIEFAGVDLVSPDGKLLVKDLAFTAERGRNVMVTGPNGSGKSSLFRVIGGLWPLHCGRVTKPPQREILFLPQKPYLSIGTLRDQLIYPLSHAQMQAQGVTDDDLAMLLSIVDPAGLILKEWRLDDVRDWSHSFSGGQKQRVGMCRLFFARPKYAILDECTSAVSDEVEDVLYEVATILHCTLFTISHRPSVRKHHDFCLNFEGGMEGKWSWTEIDKTDLSSKLTKLVK